MQKWEYLRAESSRKISAFGSVAEWEPVVDLAKLGDSGWELVSVVPVATLHGEYHAITDQIIFYLKRPKE
jgi:hypothetical protein